MQIIFHTKMRPAIPPQNIVTAYHPAITTIYVHTYSVRYIYKQWRHYGGAGDTIQEVTPQLKSKYFARMRLN